MEDRETQNHGVNKEAQNTESEEESDVSLLIEGQVFMVKKNKLIEHSDYFRAMFSGKYIETEQQEIRIDVVDANSMNIIIKYMELGSIDLNYYSISTIADIASAASFLQIIKLTEQIECFLETQLSKYNWMDIREIAQNTPLLKLEQEATIFGIFSFQYMQPEYVQTIQRLFWYLSHPYLHTDSELHVFKFGLKWIEYQEMGADTLLLILCCLDMNRLTTEDLKEIKDLIKGYVNSLAEKVVDCLYKLSTDFKLSVTEINTNKLVLCEQFTEKVFNEVLNLVKESIQRKLKLLPTVAMRTSKLKRPGGIFQHNLFHFTEESGFQQWIEAGEKNLWGWAITTWTPLKLVMVGGEYGRGSGVFQRNVRVYDIRKKEWTQHIKQLPVRRHAGIVVVDDSLFIVGGVGGYRVLLDTAIIYDLRRQTFKKICSLPEPIQSPALCVHESEVYVVAHRHIYKYQDKDHQPRWVKAVDTDLRPSCVVSFKQYIYAAQNYFPSLYRFKPGVDEIMQEIGYFSHFPLAFCNLGYKLVAIASLADYNVSVEGFLPNSSDPQQTEVIWSDAEWPYTINEAGVGAILLTAPPTTNNISKFHQRYLTMYATE